ncbi:MAG: chloride channel protein [Francisellaceae bacterium]|nr:chloride channel protein [Francisellaceae bacterium]
MPMIGSLIVVWLVSKFAPEAKGHGVPEVMNSIHNQQSILNAPVVLIKALASSISIGSGGSVGREGPIVQICSAIGSVLGQICKINTEQRAMFLAAGASAGIAATFNAPIGGLIFAVELMLININVMSLMIVIITTVTATYANHYIFGVLPAFDIPSLRSSLSGVPHPIAMLLFFPLGMLLGGGSALFISFLYKTEDIFNEFINNIYLRHLCGMTIVGVMFYGLMLYFNHYYINGVGYATIIDILEGVLKDYRFLLMLFMAKLIATSLTIGTGGSGGIFSPSLFQGACLGAAYGLILDNLFPGLNLNIVIFTIAGMAGFLSGATGASLTAIVMAFDLTRDYSAILPVMICAAIANRTRLYFLKDNIYTLKLSRRGINIKQGLKAVGLIK